MNHYVMTSGERHVSLPIAVTDDPLLTPDDVLVYLLGANGQESGTKYGREYNPLRLLPFDIDTCHMLDTERSFLSIEVLKLTRWLDWKMIEDPTMGMIEEYTFYDRPHGVWLLHDGGAQYLAHLQASIEHEDRRVASVANNIAGKLQRQLQTDPFVGDANAHVLALKQRIDDFENSPASGGIASMAYYDEFYFAGEKVDTPQDVSSDNVVPIRSDDDTE